MLRYDTAVHEAKHAVLALSAGYYVESVDLHAGVCVIHSPFPPHCLPGEYGRDPVGTGFEMEYLLSVAFAAGENASVGDFRTVRRWERQWPSSALPNWATLEAQGRIRAIRTLLDPGVAAMVRSLAGRLMDTPVLRGAALQGACREALLETLSTKPLTQHDHPRRNNINAATSNPFHTIR